MPGLSWHDEAVIIEDKVDFPPSSTGPRAVTRPKLLLGILIVACGFPASHASAEAFDPEPARKLVEQYHIDKIVMVKRATFQSSHYYTDFIDGCKYFGTDLCVLDLKSGNVTSLLPKRMKMGLINRIDVSFDARRVVFDWKADDQSGFHLWEVSVDGSGLKQLTFPPTDEKETSRKYHLFKDNPYHWANYPEKYPVDLGVYGHWSDDMHPCYLPDGGIAFVSTRCRHGILCDTPDIFTTTVLYRIDADGRGMEKLTNSAVSEANPTLLDDGRILYTRWEYVDKGDVSVKCLWAMGIDGTASAEVYGNNIAMPPSLRDGIASLERALILSETSDEDSHPLAAEPCYRPGHQRNQPRRGLDQRYAA